jgi:hypothetical protein
MKVSIESARQFVQDAEIVAGRAGADVTAGTTLAQSFDAAKTQATVIGSGVISFVEGVTAQGRDAITNSSLFAQLVAKRKVPNSDDTEAWYNAYFDALTNVGWVIQQRQFARYEEKSANFDAHKAILAVAATVLGPAVTALAVVTSTINALHSMDEDQPWIKLFNRESRVGEVGRFQIGLVSKETDKDFLVTLMAFTMKAKATLTQVLFFRGKAEDVELRHADAEVTVASEIVTGALPGLKKKLASFVEDYIAMAELPDK